MSGFGGGKGGGGGGDSEAPNPQLPDWADPYKNSQIQQGYNFDAGDYNELKLNPSTYSPFGSINYDKNFQEIAGRSVSRPHQVMELSPADMDILALNRTNTLKLGTRAYNRIMDMDTHMLDESDLPKITSKIDYSGVMPVSDLGSYDLERQRAQDAYMSQAKRLLDPVFTQNEDRLRNQLVNSGNPMGSGLYDTEVGNYRTKVDDSYRNAADQAIMNSYDVANQYLAGRSGMRQEQIGAAQLPYMTEKMQRDNEFDFQTALRNQNLGEIAALLGQGSPPQVPQLSNYQMQPMQPVDLGGFVDSASRLYGDMYKADRSAQAQENSAQTSAGASSMGSLFSMIGGLFGR